MWGLNTRVLWGQKGEAPPSCGSDCGRLEWDTTSTGCLKAFDSFVSSHLSHSSWVITGVSPFFRRKMNLSSQNHCGIGKRVK